MSAAGTKTRRKAENIIRNLETEADKLKTNIKGLTGDKKAKAEGKLAKVLAAIAERTGKVTAKAEANAEKAAKKAEANAEKAAAKVAANAKKAANRAAGIKATRRTKNEIAANLARKAEEAAKKAEEAKIAEAAKKIKQAEEAAEKAAKKAAAEEAKAFKGLTGLFKNAKGTITAAATGTKTRRNNPYLKFTAQISKGYKNAGKTLKKGVTYPTVISAYRRAYPSRYQNFVANPNAFNMANVVDFINAYEPNTNEHKMNKNYNKLVTNLFGNNSIKKKDLQKKLQKTQKKCAEAIQTLEKEIASLNAAAVANE